MSPTADPGLFPASAVERLCCIVRLRRDLGVNLAGVAVILQMRDQIKALQRELERLRRLVERGGV
jgi:MerR family transcriptional regulator/heat shock protein HspR